MQYLKFSFTTTTGVFLCLDCSAQHRQMGVHQTFVRSVDLDEWTQRQIDAMRVGGNLNAATYFRKAGFADLHGKITKKYQSKAAQNYRAELAKLVEEQAAKRGESILDGARDEAEIDKNLALDNLSLKDQKESEQELRQTESQQPVQAKATLASKNPNARGKLVTPPSSGNAPRVVLRKPSSGSSNLFKKKPSNVGMRANKLSINKSSSQDSDEGFQDIEQPHNNNDNAKEEVKELPVEPTREEKAPESAPVLPTQDKEPLKHKSSMEEGMERLKAMNSDFFANM